MENIKNFENDFDDFVSARLNSNYEELKATTNFKLLRTECINIIAELNKNFNIELFEKYRDKNAQLQSIELKFAYIQGIKDMIYIFAGLEV